MYSKAIKVSEQNKSLDTGQNEYESIIIKRAYQQTHENARMFMESSAQPFFNISLDSEIGIDPLEFQSAVFELHTAFNYFWNRRNDLC